LRKSRKFKKKKKQISYRINDEITANEVRLVGFEDKPELNGKVFPIEEALKMAIYIRTKKTGKRTQKETAPNSS